jgi:hypothetical protein
LGFSVEQSKSVPHAMLVEVLSRAGDGPAGVGTTLEYLACVAGWLVSSFPEPERQAALMQHGKQIEMWIEMWGSEADPGTLAQILRVYSGS